MLELEAKTENRNWATGANSEKAQPHRGSAALQKQLLLAFATQGLESKKLENDAMPTAEAQRNSKPSAQKRLRN